MPDKYTRKRTGISTGSVASLRMLQAGVRVLAVRSTTSSYDLLAAIYRAMHKAAPPMRSAGVPTATMLQALAILGKRAEEET